MVPSAEAIREDGGRDAALRFLAPTSIVRFLLCPRSCTSYKVRNDSVPYCTVQYRLRRSSMLPGLLHTLGTRYADAEHQRG